jgi:hypothetical protein
VESGEVAGLAVYYFFDGREVLVVAVRSAVRGAGPDLRRT